MQVAVPRDRWHAANGPQGYSSWRDEASAWLHLVAHADVVVIRRGEGVNMLFDVAAGADVLPTLRPYWSRP